MSKTTIKINPELFQIDGGVVVVMNDNNELINLLTKDDLQSEADWEKYSKYKTILLCDIQKDIEKDAYNFDALVTQINFIFMKGKAIEKNLNNNVVQFYDGNGNLQEGVVVKTELDENIRNEIKHFYEIETKEQNFKDICEDDILKVLHNNVYELEIENLIKKIKEINPEYKLLSKEELNSKRPKAIDNEDTLNLKYVEFLEMELNTAIKKSSKIENTECLDSSINNDRTI